MEQDFNNQSIHTEQTYEKESLDNIISKAIENGYIIFRNTLKKEDGFLIPKKNAFLLNFHYDYHKNTFKDMDQRVLSIKELNDKIIEVKEKYKVNKILLSMCHPKYAKKKKKCFYWISWTGSRLIRWKYY